MSQPAPRPQLSITVLGSGTCVPSATRGTAAYLVQAGDARYLMDSGSGTIARLAARDLPVNALDALFYTHTHLDHSGDLFNILFSMRNAETFTRRCDVPIFGPPGFKAHFDALLALYGRWVLSPTYRIEVEELGRDRRGIRLGALTVEAFRMRHSAVAVGYRFSLEDERGVRSLAFTGDADEGEELVPLIQGVDLAVMDCSKPDDDKIGGHLTPSGVGRAAREAGVGRVVLTHFYPPLAADPSPAVRQVEDLCGAPTVAAWDGATFTVP